MAHFAKLGANSKVIQVLTLNNSDMLNADGVEDETVGQQYLETHNNWPAQMWIQTSYNTSGGTHRNGGTPFRGNYAGIGSIYDSTNDIFHGPQPYNSWTFNLSIADWEAPVAFPSVTTYGDNVPYTIECDEDNLRWLGYDNSNPRNEFSWDPDSSSWIATGN